jgi:hypothetical protein
MIKYAKMEFCAYNYFFTKVGRCTAIASGGLIRTKFYKVVNDTKCTTTG